VGDVDGEMVIPMLGEKKGKGLLNKIGSIIGSKSKEEAV